MFLSMRDAVIVIPAFVISVIIYCINQTVQKTIQLLVCTDLSLVLSIYGANLIDVRVNECICVIENTVFLISSEVPLLQKFILRP